MKDQHRKIKGYRDLTPREIVAMNGIKGMAEQIGELVEMLAEEPDADQRWISIGKADLQTGFMALTRSIAKPTTF